MSVPRSDDFVLADHFDDGWRVVHRRFPGGTMMTLAVRDFEGEEDEVSVFIDHDGLNVEQPIGGELIVPMDVLGYLIAEGNGRGVPTITPPTPSAPGDAR